MIPQIQRGELVQVDMPGVSGVFRVLDSYEIQRTGYAGTEPHLILAEPFGNEAIHDCKTEAAEPVFDD